MVTDGVIMARDKRGAICSVKLSEIQSNFKTYQILSMNHHGHEKYSFSLRDGIKTITDPDAHMYRITTVNHMDQTYEVEVGGDAYLYVQGKRWNGFTSIDRLRTNSILLDVEDRPNRILKLEKVPTTPDTPMFEVSVKYNKNFFFNGILVR